MERHHVISYYSNVSRSFSISPIELAKGDFDQHMKAHSCKKTYKCIQCEKAFSHKSTLDTHMMTHTGEKPYQCTQCDKAFSRTSNLDTYMGTQLERNPINAPCVKKNIFNKE